MPELYTIALLGGIALATWLIHALLGGRKSPPSYGPSREGGHKLRNLPCRDATVYAQAKLPKVGSAELPGIAAVIDVETTGLSLGDELIEIAVVLFSFEWSTGRVLECLAAYEGRREPRVPIHPEAARKHKITMSELHGERLDNTRIEDFLLKAEFILAHNSNFDRRFVAKSLERMPASRWFCTMEDIQWLAHGFGSRKLESLARAHSVSRGRAHSALDDALTTLILVGRHGNLDGSMYLLEILKRAAKQQRKRVKKGVVDLQRRIDMTCHACGARIYQTVGWLLKQRKVPCPFCYQDLPLGSALDDLREPGVVLPTASRDSPNRSVP
jgi:DNA polymerase-3 subunit epsilon